MPTPILINYRSLQRAQSDYFMTKYKNCKYSIRGRRVRLTLVAGDDDKYGKLLEEIETRGGFNTTRWILNG